jgi:hypothetical protein
MIMIALTYAFMVVEHHLVYRLMYGDEEFLKYGERAVSGDGWNIHLLVFGPGLFLVAVVLVMAMNYWGLRIANARKRYV